MEYYYRKRKLIIFAFLLDFIGGMLFGLLRILSLRRTAKFPEEIKKILVVRLDHLGDILYLAPAISALRKKYPAARITLLAASWGKDLIEDNQDINEIIYFNAPWFQKGKKTNLIELFKLIVRLRKQKYDLALDFKGYLWHILLIYFAGAKYKVGYNDVGAKFLLDKALTRRTDLHAVDQNREMLKSIGIQGIEPRVIELNIKEGHHTSINKLLDKLNINSNKMIAIHCGAGRPSKMWPVENFNKLIARIFRDYPAYEVVLVGGPAEKDLISRLSFVGRKPKSIVGETRIKELAAFLGKCSLFVGNDSAPAHFAAVMGTPTIVLFNKEDDPVQWRPLGEKVFVLQKESHEFRLLNEEEIKTSLEKINVDDVWKKVKEVLG